MSNNLNNTIYFGFYEGGDGKAYLNTVTLQIWTITVPQVNITAQNNFTGGSIKVGVNTTATSHTSPFPFTAYVGNSVNLQAVEQSKDSYSMIWNDTEAPLNPSKWDRNGIVKSYNQSYSFQPLLTTTIKNITSNLRKICNQNFTNSFVGLSYKEQ
ncbi:MAG: hypothetical protein H6613_13795 [Ignavibacteriales bacterium]|nr:hypothetical protein [Ignavibacteriales bacterium]